MGSKVIKGTGPALKLALEKRSSFLYVYVRQDNVFVEVVSAGIAATIDGAAAYEGVEDVTIAFRKARPGDQTYYAIVSDVQLSIQERCRLLDEDVGTLENGGSEPCTISSCFQVKAVASVGQGSSPADGDTTNQSVDPNQSSAATPATAASNGSEAAVPPVAGN